MSVSVKAVIASFGALLVAGIKPPDEWRALSSQSSQSEAEQDARKVVMARSWAKTLTAAGLDDRRLEQAIEAYLVVAPSQWWPIAATVARHAPAAPPARQITQTSTDLEAYNALDDWGRQQVIDEADREGWWSLDLEECWRRIEAASQKQARAVLPFLGVNAR